MNKKHFSQPQSKGCPIQRQMALGLKLVYSFINFVYNSFTCNLYETFPKELPKTAKMYGEANTKLCWILQQKDCRSTAEINFVFKLLPWQSYC